MKIPKTIKIILIAVGILAILTFVTLPFTTLRMPPGCAKLFVPRDENNNACTSTREVQGVTTSNNFPSCLEINTTNCMTPEIEIINNCDFEVLIEGGKVMDKYILTTTPNSRHYQFKGAHNNEEFQINLELTAPMCNV